ncbi:hypothetical protein P3T37_003933 [Kitasatospora sp. MAA4]|nr:hypothetical protein [Kitasatospora sp. MAA4]
MITAAVALRTVTPDARQVLAERLDHVSARSLATGGQTT